MNLNSRSLSINIYEERHNKKYSNNLIKVIKREGSIIYFETEFGLCKRPLASFGRYDISITSAIDKTDYLKKQFLKIHKNLYDYSLVYYNGSNNKINIICNKHGIFEQDPAQHLLGRGCIKCRNKFIGDTKKYSLKEFIDKANLVHNNLYDYSKTVYSLSQNKVNITCLIHGEFEQVANSHLSGRGCSKCSFDSLKKLNSKNPLGWKLSKWIDSSKTSKNFDSFKVYILECWNEEEKFYKIGRTFTTVKKRFITKHFMPYEYKILKTFTGNAKDMYNLEIELKKINKQNKYIPQIKFGGMWECFKQIEK